MRLAEIVRIGGKLALAIGFGSASLVFSNSLNYFYGYTASNFGVSQASDPFSAQNVPFVPQTQTQLFSSSPGALYTPAATTPSSGSSLASSYGYTSPVPQTYSSPASNLATNVYASTYSAPAYTQSNPFGPPFGTPAYSSPAVAGFAIFSAVPTSNGLSFPAQAFSTPAVDVAVTGGINLFIAPRVTDQLISGPVAAKPSVTVTSTRLMVNDTAPEPSTWISMSAGLAFLLFKLRKR